MSGSFVLRSGVGTQMLIVSSSPTTEKSVVAESVPASCSAATSDGRHVRDVGATRVDGVDLALIEVDADGREAGAGELDGERQSDISETDHAGARLSVLDLGEKSSSGSVHQSQAPVSGSVMPNSTRRMRSQNPPVLRRSAWCAWYRCTRTPLGVTDTFWLVVGPKTLRRVASCGAAPLRGVGAIAARGAGVGVLALVPRGDGGGADSLRAVGAIAAARRRSHAGAR